MSNNPLTVDYHRCSLYPEWPHRQAGCLACCGCTFESRGGCTDLYYARGAQGVLPMRVGGATSQLDLFSLTPLGVHKLGCFSTLLKVVDN